ncbi:MAG: right-handed parallel beta-helix repeat-containing protein, partial [Armatimonadota bacterium]|nr:right-handed parallel beta-helix repeat-containing protein [Armatimonadota bacterium]
MIRSTILVSALMAALLLAWPKSERAVGQKAPPMTNYYVSTTGNDEWSGANSKPHGTTADGPFATLTRARNAIRNDRAEGLEGPVTVLIEPGTYTLAEPFVLEPEGPDADGSPVTYRGVGKERPILSGGRVLTGFHKEGNLWTLTLPEVASGELSFESLWVNGQRRTPARTPNDGYFYTVGPASPVLNPATGKMDPQDTIAFRFKPGDIQAWEHPEDVKVVVIHNWETSTLRIKSVDLQNHVVTFTGPAQWPFSSHQRYFIRNAPDALDQPGEWRLDRPTGVLSYMPLPGETLATTKIVAPVLQQLVLIQGDPANGHYVDNVHFQHLQFSHTNYPIEPGGHGDGQAAASVHATFQATGARNCSIEGCSIAHTGNYGIWWRTGCDRDRTEHNELYDLGAGGVRIGEGGDPKTPGEAVGNCLVTNNYIHDNGTIFSGACGVWIGRSSGNTISHNDIGDQDYTGVSVGWSWGYAASSANNNIIEYNHIHDLGRGVLSDMGTIYSLGVSPGTIERDNVMHDVYCYPGGYGGWGVYTDEGSSNILVENNLVYNCASGPFHQHYGQDNILRNNIFAYGITAILRRTREEDHNSFTFEHNIVASNGTPFMEAGWKNGHYTIDNNLYWDYSTPEPQFFGMNFADWLKAGHDVHSVLADPLFFRHPAENQQTFTGATPTDFRLNPASPAAKIGFVPFSTETAGLVGDPAWRSLPSRTPHKRYVP